MINGLISATRHILHDPRPPHSPLSSPPLRRVMLCYLGGTGDGGWMVGGRRVMRWARLERGSERVPWHLPLKPDPASRVAVEVQHQHVNCTAIKCGICLTKFDLRSPSLFGTDMPNRYHKI